MRYRVEKGSETQMLDRSNYKPLYVQLAEIIVEYAKDQQLNAGDILPSENELLSKFDVSRNTVRLAAERLVKMGFATKIRGQGTFITKDDNACRIGYKHGFEDSIKRLGMQVTNSLMSIDPVSPMPNWAKNLGTVEGGASVHIKRLKMVDDELLAMEERLLPAHVLGRYSHDELEKENINPYLLDQYPDTQTQRLSYVFASQSIEPADCKLLNLPESTQFLCRIGEYFNNLNERFMLSRLMVFSDRINLCYEYKKENDFWVMQL